MMLDHGPRFETPGIRTVKIHLNPDGTASTKRGTFDGSLVKSLKKSAIEISANKKYKQLVPAYCPTPTEEPTIYLDEYKINLPLEVRIQIWMVKHEKTPIIGYFVKKYLRYQCIKEDQYRIEEQKRISDILGDYAIVEENSDRMRVIDGTMVMGVTGLVGELEKTPPVGLSGFFTDPSMEAMLVPVVKENHPWERTPKPEPTIDVVPINNPVVLDDNGSTILKSEIKQPIIEQNEITG